MNHCQNLRQQYAQNNELIKSLQAQVVDLELKNFQLDLKIKFFSSGIAPEEEKIAEKNDKQKIRELIYSERPHRSTDSNLIENKSALTMKQREHVAIEKSAFRTKQRLIREKIKKQGQPIQIFDPYIHTFKLTNSTVQVKVVHAKSFSKLEQEEQYQFETLGTARVPEPGELAVVCDDETVLAVVQYTVIKEVDSRRMKIWSLKMSSDSEEAQTAVMSAIKQRCLDLKTNLVLIEVPEDEKKMYENLGFLKPFLKDEWLAERHNVQQDGEILLFFRPPNYRLDSYGPLPEQKKYLISVLAKDEKARLDDFSYLYNPDRLEEEIERRKNGNRGWKKSDNAQLSDQYETTKDVKKRIFRKYSLKVEDSWDPCSFNTIFRKDFFFDALKEQWPLNKIIFTNWPYSLNVFFLITACKQKQRGCNIISLINCLSTDGATADQIASNIYQRQIIGSLKFNNIPITNGQSYCILEFFQPGYYDQLEIDGFTNDLLAKKPYLRKELRSPQKKAPKNTQYEEETVVQLLKSGWTRDRIKKLYPVGDHAIRDIRKIHAQELAGFANPDREQSRLIKNIHKREVYNEAKQILKVQKLCDSGS